MVTDKEIVRATLDRQLLSFYTGAKQKIVNNFPLFSPLVNGYENQILGYIDEKVDLLMLLSFPTDDTTKEVGIENMNNIIKSLITKKLESFGIDSNLFNIDLLKFFESQK